MKQSFGPLRLTLVFTALVFLLGAYMLTMYLETMLGYYGISTVDVAHQHFAYIIGALLLAIACSSALASMRPLQNAATVLLLIFVHFAVFLAHGVMLVQGAAVPTTYIVAEMIYLICICTLLIRYFPTEIRAETLSKTADALVGVVQENLQKQQQEEQHTQQVIEDVKKEVQSAKRKDSISTFFQGIRDTFKRP